ncbi:hypothetical protein FACS189490_05320 [Clostridia bacterium]|nr:hypothetical protein FACS189490_05320 [Clostridia bacterium]
MILSMGEQTKLFAAAVVSGAAMGVLFDAFRILRKVTPKGFLITYAEDAIFWVVSAVVFFYVMLNLNFGEIRAFVIFGAFLGAVVYLNTLSVLVMKVSDAIIAAVKWTIRMIIAPFKLMLRLFKRPAIFIVKKIKKLLRKVRNYIKIKSRDITKEIRIITRKI